LARQTPRRLKRREHGRAPGDNDARSGYASAEYTQTDCDQEGTGMAAGNLYVSFSGESGTPVTNVLALSCADGSTLGEVLQDGPTVKELRGLALAPSNLLGVTCVKADSLVFGFGPPQNGYQREFTGLSIDDTVSPGLDHPYGIAFADAQTLYVSSQNSNVVTRFVFTPDGAPAAPDGKPAYDVTAPEIAKYLTDKFAKKHHPFYAGTWVASATGIEIDGDTPPDVPPDDGGLTFDDKGKKKNSVRGILIVGGTLYVADEAKDRVGMYDLASGKYLGRIDQTGGKTQSPPSALSKPVALALGPDGRIYIGSPGNCSIFAYAPDSGALAWIATDTTALAELSGLAYGPDTLYVASRKTMAVYTFAPDGNNTSGGTFTQFNQTAFTDSPEALLYVPAS
jgi:hypothetical protein